MWFGLIGTAGLTQFVSFFVLNMIVFVSLRMLGHDPERMSIILVLVSFALSVVVAIAVTIYAYRTQMVTFWDPPKSPMPRRRWGSYANVAGASSG
jgi:NADH:ubiquinone oxidoreductase subunit 5 (subunit L)/multisubunit Na+/H+ antiporter MnhA subunit